MAASLLVVGACASGPRPDAVDRGQRCLSSDEIAAAVSGIAVNDPAMTKLDLSLSALLLDLGPRDADRNARRTAADCVPRVVDVLIWFTGDPDDLRNLGFMGAIVERPDRKTASGRVPTTRLLELARIDHVVAAYGPEPLHP